MANRTESKVMWNKNNIESRLCTLAKRRARDKGLEFTLTKKDVELPEYCPLIGIKLKSNIGNGRGSCMSDSYSIDRIDTLRGYTKDNIQVISHKANAMKSNASKDELLKFAKWIISTYLD
tara:strand:- start:1361 stop:1720 length:360 start_codon:yes stop_codon:yes gene_type:complete